MPQAGRRGRVTTARTLFGQAALAAERYGDREFLVVGRRTEVLTFRQLAERADRFGRGLAAMGIAPGDRVALWMPNQVDWAVAAYGAARCGAVLVAVNTRLTAREVAHLLALTTPKTWLMEETFLGKVDAAGQVAPVLHALAEQGVPAPRIVIRGSTGRVPSALDWAAIAEADAPPLPPAELLAAGITDPELQGAAVIVSTSGTTGAPKGVVLGHEPLIRLAEAVSERQGLRPGERFYSVGPMFHCSGFMHGLLCNLVSGSSYYTTQAYDAAEAWDVFRTERITLYHGFAIPLQEMALLPGFDPSRLRLRSAWYGAPGAEMARLEQVYGARMCELFGLTECGGNASLCWPDDPADMRHASDGRPLPGIEVRITDPATGQPLPDGTPGEILIRGWNLMLGYFRDQAATARAIDAQGFLHTGDMGVALPDGFIRWDSRLKDMIRVGGENLSPLEVEGILVQHPAVAQAAVVAAPHPRLQEVPVAFLILHQGQVVSDADLHRHCRAQLASFKVPVRFVTVTDFPRTDATMRVQKARLRDMAQALQDA